MTTTAPARPAFGTVLADQMTHRDFHATGAGAPTEIVPTAPIDDASRGARAALRQHLLRGLQGLSLRRRQHPRVSHGPAHRAHAPERAAAACCRSPTPRSSRAWSSDVIDRSRDQVPEAAGRAVSAARAVRHDAEHRRGLAAVERSDADRAREPGVGLLLGRHEAAAHLRRGPAPPHRGAPRHGQDRRQLRRGDGPDARARKAKYNDRPGAVLPGRLGAGNRRRQFPADPRQGTSSRAASIRRSCTA